MEYKVYDCNSYRIHTIKTDKFKNCSMEIMFRNKIEKNKITETNMLVDTLMHSSKRYPQRRDVVLELENLYASSLRGFVSRLGETIMVSFVMDFLHPKYCEEGFLEDAIRMPFEMLQNPNITGGEFDKRSFTIIKNRIKSEIESFKENATRYAFRRCLELVDSNSPTSYYLVGYKDDLENITTKSLVKTYNDLLENYVCDIYVIGNLEMDKVVSLIKSNFNNRTIKTKDLSLYTKNEIRKRKQEKEEFGEYEQDSFIMAYNLNDLTQEERNYIFPLYNVILGSGGLTSKLYQYLREKNSLCYSVSSMYQKYDQLLLIYAGINKKDKDKCIELVNKAMKEMEEGDFTDEILENAKKTLVSSLKMSEDTQGGIINNYLFYELDGLPMYVERAKGFKKVTKEEIIKVTKKIKINTIYLLGGEE